MPMPPVKAIQRQCLMRLMLLEFSSLYLAWRRRIVATMVSHPVYHPGSPTAKHNQPSHDFFERSTEPARNRWTRWGTRSTIQDPYDAITCVSSTLARVPVCPPCASLPRRGTQSSLVLSALRPSSYAQPSYRLACQTLALSQPLRRERPPESLRSCPQGYTVPGEVNGLQNGSR